MPTMIISGIPVDVTDDGYFRKPEAWTEDMAPEIAARLGLDHLTEDHWQVIRYVRARYLTKKRPPYLRVVSKQCGVSMKQLYQLFPERPIKMAANIAGVPEPQMYVGGCVANWGPWR